MEWPNQKKFAFTIIDDTDCSTVENTKPVYDFLYENGMLTTKTVWVYPSRDSFSGDSLQDKHYLDYILDIEKHGFEIALHNVGAGAFSRSEILSGIEWFNEKIGYFPRIQINHASNPDNIYWGHQRYGLLVRSVMRLLYGTKRNFFGDDEQAEHFWGDFCKKHIKFIRNHTFNGINTYKYDSQMPYKVKNKMKCSNYWFSSSDGHTVEEFNNLILPEKVDYLERSKGFCVVYTHFGTKGFVTKNQVEEKFKKQLSYLSSKKGWFIPAGQLFDYLLSQKTMDNYISTFYQNKLDLLWIVDRIRKKIQYGR